MDNQRGPTEVQLPEVIQSTALHSSEDEELGGAPAGIGHGGVGLPGHGPPSLGLGNAPATDPRGRLQVKLVEVIHVP